MQAAGDYIVAGSWTPGFALHYETSRCATQWELRGAREDHTLSISVREECGCFALEIRPTKNRSTIKNTIASLVSR